MKLCRDLKTPTPDSKPTTASASSLDNTAQHTGRKNQHGYRMQHIVELGHQHTHNTLPGATQAATRDAPAGVYTF